MLIFSKSYEIWWRKPLVSLGGRNLPAELVILRINQSKDEQGVWINSRGYKSGEVDLIKDKTGYKTKRIEIPLYVASIITKIYSRTNKRRGCPDLVIWHNNQNKLRFIEVKCSHWDHVREGQEEFINAAEALGINTEIIEWEFQQRPTRG